MRPNIYTTNHTHSRVVCSAFAEGCGGKIVPPTSLLDGPAVVYGILRGCGEIIKECEWVGRDYYHIDHGYFKRGHYDGYYRISKNGLQAPPRRDNKVSLRFTELELPLGPWKRDGRHIVVCPISKVLGEFLGIDAGKWETAVVRELSKHTDRPIVVKPKDGVPLTEALHDAWCLVTYSSNSAVDAIVNGTPAVVLGKSAAAPVAWKFENIENPVWPDRAMWVSHLADNQFTLEEMRNGTAWNLLNNTA